MAKNEYHFITRWSFDASIEEVAVILEDVETLAHWWPSVYLRVNVLDEGDANGIGKRVDLLTKGYLPYKLRWHFEVVSSDAPRGYAIEARGDFHGVGKWVLEQDGAKANVTYDWRVAANKPLLKKLSWLMKPVFSWNHHWAMEQGDRCLRAEIERRRGASA